MKNLILSTQALKFRFTQTAKQPYFDGLYIIPTNWNEFMIYQQRMREKLAAALKPALLEIQDDSARHAGHAGHDPEGETHFRVRIVSDAFDGLNRVARHRLIYNIVAEELKERVHALVLDIKTPNEHNPQ